MWVTARSVFDAVLAVFVALAVLWTASIALAYAWTGYWFTVPIPAVYLVVLAYFVRRAHKRVPGMGTRRAYGQMVEDLALLHCLLLPLDFASVAF